MANKYETKKIAIARFSKEKDVWEERIVLRNYELCIVFKEFRNYVGITDGKQSKRNETLVKSNINCEKYTMNNNLYGKLEIFFLKVKKK